MIDNRGNPDFSTPLYANLFTNTLNRWLLSLNAPVAVDRRRTVQALGEIGPVEPEVVPALITALGDIDEDVRMSVADALGRIGPAAAEAVPALISILDNAAARVRVHAAEALVQISLVAPGVVPALITALSHADAKVRDQADEALSNIGPATIKAVSALITALSDADKEISRRAANALMRIGPLAPDLAPALSNPQTVLGYYFRAFSGPQSLNEAKLILVGSGEVGKTSLVNRLVYDIFNRQEPETKGIRITQWPIILHTREQVCLHIWDFGGQEIMHSTHQFFLTQWTLYLLVLDGRRGREEEDAEYWLGLIDSFAPDSPVIIVLNKIKEHRFTVDRRVLQKKFPNIHNFVETDCEDRTGIDRLFQAIQRELDRLEHLRDPFPNSWFAIKNRLAGMADNYLTFYRYREICREEGETDVQAQDSLALYLHSMGIVLNYKDDLRLRDTYVLNPRWVTEGIYSILSCDRVAQCKGELSLEDLKEILDVEGYLPEHYRFILEMMRKFELAFQFGDEDGRYLIPELLNKEQPTEADAFTLEQCLNFKYQYPILPEGLLPRFIVRSYVLSVDRPRWRTGVILDLEGSRALVRANKLDKCVQISVTGRMMGRRQLLTVIRSDFEHIHRSYKFKPQEIVPVPNHPEVLVPYNDLRVMEQEGLVEFPMVAGEKLISVKVKDMLDGVDLEGMRPATSKEDVSVRKLQLFYSYSHKDEKLRDELATHLKIFKRQGLIQQWHDREITAGTEWKGQIDDNLEHADIILLLVSADFIASDYCYDIEMNRALQRHEEGSAHVIPIIISDVNWHNTPFGKLQALPEDDRTVVRRGSGRYARAQAWKKVADGIEKVLKTWK